MRPTSRERWPEPELSERQLRVFVPVRLVSKNARDAHWSGRSKRARLQVIAVEATITAAMWPLPTSVSFPSNVARRRWRFVVGPRHPKVVRFHAHVGHLMDDDGLTVACSHVRDGLKRAGVIHDDDPRSGHTFSYTQAVAKPLGVWVTVLTIEGAAIAATEG